MKPWWIALILLFLLTSCGETEPSTSDTANPDENTEPQTTAPDITGYVMDQEEDRILVVEPVSEGEADGSVRAMWVSGVTDELWIGKQVEVWTAGPIMESYPSQSTAENVSVLEMSEVQGADLSATTALSSILSDLKKESLFTVKMISFDQEEDQWTVKLTDLQTQDELKKVIKDEK